MGYIQVRTSDISGEPVEDANLVEVIVRNHPGVDEAKRLDASVEEVAGFKSAGNFVNIELKLPDGKSRTLSVQQAAFDKLVKAEVLQAAPGLRGRRPGFKPGAKNGDEPKDDAKAEPDAPAPTGDAA